MRKILIWVPTLFILFLLQSYFWVPTYDQQARRSPGRLLEYIEASIGDAQILNPIISSDSASSTVHAKIYEGLIDRDEDLNFRGRLAREWEIFEEAYFYVNTEAEIPGTGKNEPEEVIRLIREAVRESKGNEDPVSKSLGNIREISLAPLPPFEQTREETIGDEKTQVTFRVSPPPRIRLVLNEVDQDLFESLQEILGADYFSRFAAARHISPDRPVPEAKMSVFAESLLPATEHNPVIIFHLRSGVTFHDGAPFDAKDIKFTYEAIMNPRNLSPRISDYEPVKAVEIIDPLTVRIVYKRLFSPAFATWGMGILPSHLMNPEALRKEAMRRGLDPDDFTLRQSELNRRPIGCGPFKFREWLSDQYVTLDRFEDYWEGAPNYHHYTFRVIPDLLTQEMEFYAGTIDSYGVQPHQVARLSESERFQSFSGLSFSYSYIGYNTRREPFDDPRIRRAMGMAIDIEKILRYVQYEQGERITGPFLKQTAYYNTGIAPLPYDPGGALALLAEAGWKRGKGGWLEKNGRPFSFTLITNQGNDIRRAILSIAQDAWRKIGIDVRTDVLEWAVFIQERVNKLDFDALVLGWSMGIEPDLYQIWHSSQSQPGGLNFVGFNNPEADALIITIRQEYNHDRQVEYTHRLHEIIAQEQPYTFLYAPKWTAVLDKRIVVQTVDADGNAVYEKIRPTKTGNFQFYFNQWIKLAEAPEFGVR
jgi:ABC-type transport system substrate-binding protein